MGAEEGGERGGVRHTGDPRIRRPGPLCGCQGRLSGSQGRRSTGGCRSADWRASSVPRGGRSVATFPCVAHLARHDRAGPARLGVNAGTSRGSRSHNDVAHGRSTHRAQTDTPPGGGRRSDDPRGARHHGSGTGPHRGRTGRPDDARPPQRQRGRWVLPPDLRAGVRRRRRPTGRLSTSTSPRAASAAPTGVDQPRPGVRPQPERRRSRRAPTTPPTTTSSRRRRSTRWATSWPTTSSPSTRRTSVTSALADRRRRTSSDALVMLVYNVQDESYYDCSVDTYTAGYFAPEYINEAGMNVIVVDAYDWANRIGDRRRRRPAPVRGRHRPRARAPAHELLRPR